MCFIIALVLFAFSYHLFLQSELFGGFGALAGALFFVALMVKNIFGATCKFPQTTHNLS